MDDWLLRQPTLVTKKRQVVPVLMQRQQLVDSLGRQLERLGLKRKAKEVPSLQAYLAARAETPPRPAEVAPSSASPASPPPSEIPAGGADISGTVGDGTAPAHTRRSEPT